MLPSSVDFRGAGEEDFAAQRRVMVERQLASRGVRSAAVLRAMGRVRREAFLPSRLRARAYEDSPQPIGDGQTISQPYVVALMIEALELAPTDRVLEVGAGSGYAAAVLAELAGEVFAIERLEGLTDEAGRRLASEGYEDVHLRCADGTLGWPDEAPFDAILVSAGAPEVPDALARQLAVGGRLVVPVGSVGEQILLLVRRVDEDRFERETLGAVRFVPLVGQAGWGG